MTTLADLRATLDTQARDIPSAEDVLARLPRRRSRHAGLLVAAAAVVALAAAVLVVVLRSGTSAEPADHAWKTFRTAGFSVRYPATWHAATYSEVSSFSTAIVFLSDQPMSNPCTTTSDAKGTTTSCRGGAVRHLKPGGVSISWYEAGFPSRDLLGDATGTPTWIGGLPAKVSIAEGCSGAGSTTVRATVALRGVANNAYMMNACVAAPRNSRQVAQVLKSLRSMRQSG